MLNLLGAEIETWEDHLADSAKLHVYGKRRAVDGRKMAHVVKLRPRS